MTNPDLKSRKPENEVAQQWRRRWRTLTCNQPETANEASHLPRTANEASHLLRTANEGHKQWGTVAERSQTETRSGRRQVARGRGYYLFQLFSVQRPLPRPATHQGSLSSYLSGARTRETLRPSEWTSMSNSGGGGARQTKHKQWRW